MVQPTPWQSNKTGDGGSAQQDQAVGGIAPGSPQAIRAALRGYWGYVWAAVGSLVTLVLLFQPWITAAGADGRVSTTAFGRMEITTRFLNAWSASRPRTPHVTGFWALLACAAIVIAILAIVINLRLRIDALSRLATIATLVTSMFVLFTVLYINSKGPELKAMVGRSSDLGGQVGSLINWAFGNGRLVVPGVGQVAYTSAGLTPWALLAGATSLASSVAAVTQWIRNRSGGLFQLPWRINVVSSKRPADTDDAD
ncbi:hypothetical protein [Nocardia gipuzkoensis]|uniref:hypothetical protein n=1 Tax=Nocardia gipuzkoensis TaxID=2749991 RepID=UPI00237DEEBC|nr:hypothetical protein [Nocardia gipuzkoensis]MDE1674003.1 hypothetical protein [Nocardia gipuzkoensis]